MENETKTLVNGTQDEYNRGILSEHLVSPDLMATFPLSTSVPACQLGQRRLFCIVDDPPLTLLGPTMRTWMVALACNTHVVPFVAAARLCQNSLHGERHVLSLASAIEEKKGHGLQRKATATTFLDTYHQSRAQQGAEDTDNNNHVPPRSATCDGRHPAAAQPPPNAQQVHAGQAAEAACVTGQHHRRLLRRIHGMGWKTSVATIPPPTGAQVKLQSSPSRAKEGPGQVETRAGRGVARATRPLHMWYRPAYRPSTQLSKGCPSCVCGVRSVGHRVGQFHSPPCPPLFLAPFAIAPHLRLHPHLHLHPHPHLHLHLSPLPCVSLHLRQSLRSCVVLVVVVSQREALLSKRCHTLRETRSSRPHERRATLP